MILSLRIRTLLAARGMSGVDLAREAGLHSVTVSRILNDRQKPHHDNLEAIAAALGISSAYLLGPELEALVHPSDTPATQRL